MNQNQEKESKFSAREGHCRVPQKYEKKNLGEDSSTRAARTSQKMKQARSQELDAITY